MNISLITTLRTEVGIRSSKARGGELSCEPHPVKRTMKNYKIFPGWQLRLPAAFLRREVTLVLLHRRQDAEIALYTSSVVIADVSFDHSD